MDFRLLGPVEVRDHGVPVRLGGTRQRTLVAALALRAGHAVSVARLTDDIWDGAPPATADQQVRSAVSQLRRVLGDRIATRPTGYQLRVAPGDVDVHAFQATVATARGLASGGSSHRAGRQFRQALALWRGPALDGVTGMRAEARCLEEYRLAVLEECLDLELALGRELDRVAELVRLVHANPLRERLRGQLMVALYRCGRQAEAVTTFHEARRLLREELGMDPDRRLLDLYARILARDPSLDGPHPNAFVPGRPDQPVVALSPTPPRGYPFLHGRTLGQPGAQKPRLPLDTSSFATGSRLNRRRSFPAATKRGPLNPASK